MTLSPTANYTPRRAVCVPLNLFLPLALFPLITTSPAQHHIVYWSGRSQGAPSNAFGQRLLRSVPLDLPLHSPLHPVVLGLIPRRSRLQVSIPYHCPRYPLAFELASLESYYSSLYLYPDAHTARVALFRHFSPLLASWLPGPLLPSCS